MPYGKSRIPSAPTINSNTVIIPNVTAVGQSFREKTAVVMAQLRQLQSEIEPIVKMLEDPETTSFVFMCQVPSTDRNALSSLLGKLASEILMQNWKAAMEDLTRLRETIDNNSVSSPLQSLEQRTWLIHWSLFVFFNHPEGRDNIIDLFLYQPQNVAPQKSYTHKDHITEFVECLYVNFDFDSAQKKPGRVGKVLVNDFFLVACLKVFIKNAHLFIFETFCRIHQCISFSMLADKLNMTPEEAERWIVNLIRNARLDAKIDPKLGHVVMGNNAVSPYQQVIEKTESLFFRSQMLPMNIEMMSLSNRNETPN
ncbi:eukaryotic translation initiation factor 3 subunit E-B [Silurus meridionalis]|uniref:eukaryotic translation initiation factor 3 subunit E-B n=1 Tax=Silurus meridionalis TaxID=175797 RepID=UPI001EEA9DF3|nr:eukaryotic translation initiation factor 3 subunit E-B [Silurus meridionalis]